MNIEIIKGALNRRHPYLLIDKILEFEPGERITVVKNVSYSDWYFDVTYLGERYVPAFVLNEIMTQAAEAGLLLSERYKGKKFYLTGTDKCRYHRRVIPGDVLTIVVEMDRLRLSSGTVKVKAYIEQDEACEASLLFNIE